MNNVIHKSEVCMSLESVRESDLPEVGAKAAHLGELLHHGFDIPPGFVLPASSFQNRSETERINGEMRREIADNLARLGEGPVAVRSSGIAEDGDHASFAGQYTTLLNVHGLDDVVRAVDACIQSSLQYNVMAYGRTMNRPDVQRMAVLVQQQIAPRCAGVAFSADPRTGDRETVVINAVSGLGDRLVSGEVTPDSWSVRGEVASCEHAVENCLTESDAVEIASLARRLAAFFGKPQDIEWAFAGSRLHLLQARPITGVTFKTSVTERPASESSAITPVPVSATPPHGFWERNDTYYPFPLSPMFRSFFLGGLNAAYRRFFADCGALALGGESREIGGWVYMRLVPLGGRDMPIPPSWAMRLAFKLVPAFRKRIATSVEAIREDRFGGYIARWKGEWKPSLQGTVDAALSTPLDRLSDAELTQHVAKMRDLVLHALEIHFLIIGAHFFPLADLAFTCKELLGWDEPRCLQLISGLSETSTAPAAAMQALVDFILARPALRTMIVEHVPLPELLDSDAAFRAAFEEYLQHYGHRVLRYEVSEPTVAEQPETVLGWLRGQLMSQYAGTRVHTELTAAREAAVESAFAALADQPASVRQRFERVLARATEAYPLREENEISTLSSPLAVMRYAVLALGRRLQEKGCLDDAKDVFWLEFDDAMALLASAADGRGLVERRKGELAWVKAHPAPRTYGKAPSIPAQIHGLPPEAYFVFRACLWMRNHGFAPDESSRRQMPGERIEGIPASGGSYTGPARIVLDETQFSKVQPGDVLVCPITAPVWSVLFASVGALVTDTGGLLSHSAIIAREFGIPALVATGNATHLLHDGQIVTVDGDNAEVRILSR